MVSAHFTSLNIDYIFLVIYNAFLNINSSSFLGSPLETLLLRAWFITVIVGYLLTAIAIFVLIYSSVKLAEVRRNDELVFGPILAPVHTKNKKNARWQHIKDLTGSTNINDWRQAIIESDIILGELLTSRGYKGDSIGEQLKQVTVADFATLKDAWEAHRVRNEIAHGGSSFNFSDVFARRTIDQYENIFREFNLI